LKYRLQPVIEPNTQIIFLRLNFVNGQFSLYYKTLVHKIGNAVHKFTTVYDCRKTDTTQAVEASSYSDFFCEAIHFVGQ